MCDGFLLCRVLVAWFLIAGPRWILYLPLSCNKKHATSLDKTIISSIEGAALSLAIYMQSTGRRNNDTS
jgi:hypothetical protein